jgi:hypothetical protein
MRLIADKRAVEPGRAAQEISLSMESLANAVHSLALQDPASR